MVDPLPHQITGVYEAMVPRRRYAFFSPTIGSVPPVSGEDPGRPLAGGKGLPGELRAEARRGDRHSWDEIDEACLPATYADDILDSREVKIVAETLAIGGKLLMTRSIRTIIDSVHVAE